jgi:hypothetical protein
MNLKHCSRRLVVVAGATLAIAAPVAGAHTDPAMPPTTSAGHTGYAYEGRDLVPLASGSAGDTGYAYEGRDLVPLASGSAGDTGYAYEGRDLVPLASGSGGRTPAVQAQRSPASVSGGFDWAPAALIVAGLLAVASLATALGRRRHMRTAG